MKYTMNKSRPRHPHRLHRHGHLRLLHHRVGDGAASANGDHEVDYGLRAPFWVFVAGLVVGHLMLDMRAAVCPKCGWKSGDKT